MIFIINLEKKCPPKEEYEVFFEKLKGIMAARSKNSPKSKKSFFSTIKYAAGKLSDDMTFMRSRIGTKSAKVQKRYVSFCCYLLHVLLTHNIGEAVHGNLPKRSEDYQRVRNHP